MDRLKSNLGLVMSIAGVLALVLQVGAWASGKVGVVVTGPPERIDSLVEMTQSAIRADSARHATMDSTNAVQDRRIASAEQKDEMILALLCVNTKPRDLALTRIPCDQYIGRWRAPGGRP